MSIRKGLGLAGKWRLPGTALALAVVVILTFTLALPGAAWGFAGGDGTEGNPYEIATPEQLDNVRNNLSAHYILIENIDLSVHLATYYENVGWMPINNFAGTFGGDGHTVSNLFINRSGTNNVGLFGSTGSGAGINNLGLEDVEITGRAYVGGLVGNNNGTVTNSYVTGTVESSRLDWEAYAGGLAGCNNGDITNSYTTSNVQGYVPYVGGLVGYNEGNITNSYATRNVTSTGNYVGGLVGLNYNGTISNSYATGDVTGSSCVGGLVGQNSNSTISYSYAAGAVTGSDLNRVGGLVGVMFSGAIASSYYNWCTSGQSQYGNSKGIPKSSTEMAQSATFNGWDFSGTWSINERESYPYLQWSSHVPAPPSATEVTVSSSELAFTYGDASTALTASVAPTCAVQIVNWSTSDPDVAAVDENGVVIPVGAGEAAITASATTGGVTAQTNVTVSKKELTIGGTFTAENKEYDGDTKATINGSGLTLVGIVEGDNVSLNAVAAFADANAADGITVSLTDASLNGSDADNYKLALTGVPTTTANIIPKKLTVTAEDKSKTYGAADPGFTITYNGFITGEDKSVLGGELSFTRAPGEDAGAYAITPAGLTANNYDITFISGNLTITEAQKTNSGSGGGGSSSSSTYVPNPVEETIEDTEGTDTSLLGDDAVDKEASTTGDGKSVETFTVKKDVRDQITKARTEGKTSVEINVRSSKADVTVVNVPREVLESAEGLSVKIATPKVVLEIPDALVKTLASTGDLSVRVERGDAASTAAQMAGVQGIESAALLGTPAVIKTPVRGTTTVTLSLAGITFPDDPEARTHSLANLRVLAIHSDGEKKIIAGEVVYDNEGNPTDIRFTVDKFSTFAVIEMTEETAPAPVTPKRVINLTIGTTEGRLDGSPYTLDAAPLVRPEANRTLVPIRFISEALGARVDWLAETQEVVIREMRDGQQMEIILIINSEEALMNGVPVTLDCAAEILPPGRTFVPLRFVSETLGAQVDWDGDKQQITITR